MTATGVARAGLDQPSPAAILAATVAVPALILVPLAAGDPYRDVWGGLAVAAVLAVLTVIILQRAIREEADYRVARLLALAPVAKVLGMLARYYVTLVLLPAADANEYHEEGVRLAVSYAQLDFTEDLGRRFVGTGFIRALTGVIYVVTGPNRFAGFVVYSFLAFCGTYFLFRAFSLGLPDGDRRRYAVLLFFLPSLLFWPSSIGKESWMLFSVGLGAWGGARLVWQQRGAMVLLALGLLATAVVRPHMALILFAGIAAAYLLRKGSGTSVSPARRAVGLLALVVVGSLLLVRFQTFFGIDDVSSGSVQQVLDDTQAQTSQANSEFTPARVRTPLDLPAAFLTVLYRPLPHEADNLIAVIAASEAVVLLALTVTSARRLRSLPRRAVNSPYVALAAVYTTLFIVAFSTIGNFGILARQRVQVMPFVLVGLALPQLARPPRLPR